MYRVLKESNEPKREVRSFINSRDPSVDRRFRPCPERQVRLVFDNICENEEDDSSALPVSLYSEHSQEDSAASSAQSTQSTNNASGGPGDGALVFLRLRPVEDASQVYTVSESGDVLIVGPSSESCSTSNNKNAMEKHFSFTEIFDDKMSQQRVYENCMQQRIQEEESFTVLTYGTSGSGKTFTLLGDDDRPGIIPRSMEHIFSYYADNLYKAPALKLVKGVSQILDDISMAKECQLRKKMLNSCPSDVETQYTRLIQKLREEHDFHTNFVENVSVYIWISFAEIYNELVYDLLEPPPGSVSGNMAPPARKNLKIANSNGHVFIKGLTSVFVQSSVEAMQLLTYGRQRASYGTTSINANSSRSHCIFFVDILKYYRSGDISETSYKFCDLAGSERLHKTGNVGSRLKEAQRINTSLMVLGRCIDAANSNRKHEVIPYRESKLTMLLQAPLLGKEKLAMIVNVTPSDKYYEENMNVLGFSSIAKNIIFREPVVRQNTSRYSFFLEYSKTAGITGHKAQSDYITQLLDENLNLQAELHEARNELASIQQRHNIELHRQEHDLRQSLVDTFEKTLQQNKEEFERRLQRELDNQKRSYESKIAALKRNYEYEIEDLKEELEEQKANSQRSQVSTEEQSAEGASVSKKRRTVA